MYIVHFTYLTILSVSYTSMKLKNILLKNEVTSIIAVISLSIKDLGYEMISLLPLHWSIQLIAEVDFLNQRFVELYFIKNIFNVFIFFLERGREYKWHLSREEQRERERESQAGYVLSAQSQTRGLIP